MLRKLSERIFWNIYAFCYDSIARLNPYQRMQEEVLHHTFSSAGQDSPLTGAGHDSPLRGAGQDAPARGATNGGDSPLLDATGTLLDAGCGSGNFLRLLTAWRDHPVITAVDASTVMMARARKKCRSQKIQWEKLDLNAPLPYGDEAFDRVVCTNVLFALDDPRRTLEEFQRVLKPGGRVVVATAKGPFDTNKILREHLRSLRSVKAWLRFLPLLAPLGVATLCNRIMRKKSRKQKYHLFTEEELRLLFTSARLGEFSLKTTYAGQSWLAVATKPERPGSLYPVSE